MPTLELLGQQPLSSRVTHFVFQAPFAHRAGQYLALAADLGAAREQRYYSIASPPQPDRRIELCIRHDGVFGSHLASLRPGETVACSRPAGAMHLLDPDRPAVYFGAGTGVAPLRAILLEHLRANPRAEAALVLGAREPEELLYGHEFENLAARHPGFRFLPTVSGEAPDWEGRRGRAAAHLPEAVAGRGGLDAYICGHREMVALLRERLAAAGIPDERQAFERY